MVEGIHALTEKEKAALRLLLAGHDAKSMAQQLGLSVHTVNERLREARRKLSVSSSKAAARILHDVEGPQLLGDRYSGDAGPGAIAHSAERRPMPSQHHAAWTIGGSAMIALFITALAIASTGPTASPTPAAVTEVTESDASRAARDWLTLVDARKWQESWAATGATFRTVNSIANWQAAAEQVHARFGPAVSRELLSDQDTPAPPNGFRAIRFRTNFADNRAVTEVLSLVREGNQWRVVGIYVE